MNTLVKQFAEDQKARLDNAERRAMCRMILDAPIADGAKRRLLAHAGSVQFTDDGREVPSIPLTWMVDAAVACTQFASLDKWTNEYLRAYVEEETAQEQQGMNLKEQIPMTAQMSDESAKVDRGADRGRRRTFFEMNSLSPNFRRFFARRQKKKYAAPEGWKERKQERVLAGLAEIDEHRADAVPDPWQRQRHKKKGTAQKMSDRA